MKVRCIKGDINFTLNKIYDFENCIIIDDNGNKYAHRDLGNLNYCLFPKFEEVKEKITFKVGDRVKLARLDGENNDHKEFLNKTGEIVGFIKHTSAVKVKFDRFVGTYIQWAKNLELVKELTPSENNPLGFEPINIAKDEYGNEIFRNYWRDEKGISIGYDINKKKEGKDMKILNIYEDKMASKINEEFNVNKDKITKNDKNLKEYYKIVESVENYNKELKKLDINHEVTMYKINDLLTQKSKDEIEKIEEIRKEKLNELDTLLQEVKARIELSETEESKIEVLKLYEILDATTGKIKEV